MKKPHYIAAVNIPALSQKSNFQFISIRLQNLIWKLLKSYETLQNAFQK